MPPFALTCALVPLGLEQSGDMNGRYKLIEPIGEGDFDIVWCAEQSEHILHEAALKVIKPGMDKREITARFEAERQASLRCTPTSPPCPRSSTSTSPNFAGACPKLLPISLAANSSSRMTSLSSVRNWAQEAQRSIMPARCEPA